jgi:alpha-L-fucosidase 2
MDPYGSDGLVLPGKSADYLGVEGKMRYEARIKAVPEGGIMRTDDVNLVIENANSVTLYFAAATNFVNYKDVSADQHQRVNAYFNAIENKNYQQIFTSAVADYKKYFDSYHPFYNCQGSFPDNPDYTVHCFQSPHHRGLQLQ